MDATNIMANPQVTNEKPLAKPGANNVDKTAGKNSGTGTEKQEKDFGNVLEEVVKQTEQVDEPKAEEAGSLLPLGTATAPIAIVDIVSVPQTWVMAEGSEGVFEAGIAAKPQENLSPQGTNKLTAFVGQLENSLAEPKASPDSQSVPQTVITAGSKSTSQDLLNMLSGKTAAANLQVNATAVGLQTSAIGVQANVNNTQLQPEKPQQTTMVLQHDSEGESTVSPVTKNAAGQGNQTALSQENFFSSDKEGKNFFQNLTAEAVSDGVKQPKVTVADLLKQNNIEMQSKDLTETGAFVKPEVLTDGPEQVKVNMPQFMTSVVDMRTTINQPIVQNASPETPETMAKYNIPDQIIEQAKLIKTAEDTQMVIKLRPEHLGELTLKVTVEHGVVSATFHSDNANVRSMIEASLLQLRQELTAQGIKVDNVGVYSGLGDFLSNGQNQAQGDQRGAKSKNKKIDLADFADEAEKLNPTGTDNASSDGVDYRI